MKPLADMIAEDEEMLNRFASRSQQCRGLYQSFPELIKANFPSLNPEGLTRTRSKEPTEPKTFFGMVQNLFREKNAKDTLAFANARLSSVFAARKWQ